MPKCIVCYQEMKDNAYECEECGDSIHKHCRQSNGCPTCQEQEERASKREPVRTTPKPSPRDVEPPAVPTRRSTKVETETKKDIPIDFGNPRPLSQKEIEEYRTRMGTKVPRSPKIVKGDKVLFTKVNTRVIIGNDCPTTGKPVTIKAVYEKDSGGFYGYGNTEQEALENLNSYVFRGEKT